MAGARARWGYVEGYYGRMLDWPQRAALVAQLGALGANTYFYAPKEDALHRRDWRTPYGAAWRREFAALARRARRAGVELIPGLAPGLSYRYLDERDYRQLLRKFRAFLQLGCRSLALLMDDISPALPADCVPAFRTLGHAHGQLLARLRRDLGPGVELWFCPTVYTDQFASGSVARDPYLLDLAATMPRSVVLMWTGPRIIAERLTRANLGAVSRLFRGNVVLWDNYYANDYCPNRLFVGAYAGRGHELWRCTRGVLLNPTGLPATDALLLELLAAARRGAPPVRAWRAALLRAGVPAEFRTVAGFLSSPFARVADAPPDGAQHARLARALHPLIWDWKGALHREWYPYLFMLAADLRLAGGGARARESGWLRKTYGPLLAGQLLAQTEATRRGRGPRRQVGDDGEDTVTSWPWVAPA